MSENEILEEQQKLFQSLDPKVLEFLTSRRTQLPENESQMLMGSSEEKKKSEVKLKELEIMDCGGSLNLEQPIIKSEKIESTTKVYNSGIYCFNSFIGFDVK